MIIQPYNLLEYKIEDLINQKQILISNSENLAQFATIFPESTELNYTENKIITKIKDTYFSNDFIILNKYESVISINNDTGKKQIKCKEFGDFNNSIKRFTNLNTPLDISTNGKKFLNINNKNTIKVIDTFKGKVKTINHPFINVPKQINIPKFNNIILLNQIFKQAKEQNITYIYCINEYRPNIINNSYVTPYVYYTVTGF